MSHGTQGQLKGASVVKHKAISRDYSTQNTSHPLDDVIGTTALRVVVLSSSSLWAMGQVSAQITAVNKHVQISFSLVGTDLRD